MGGELFFTSDTHFNHEKVVSFCNRPFASLDEMNEELIKRWNSVVTSKDTIWHLGDFAWKQPDIIFPRLNGKKHLIIGNHDTNQTTRLGWESVQDYKRLKAGDDRIILFHYPITEWEGKGKGAFHLHGHLHSKSNAKGKMFADVGVDITENAYAPISWAELRDTIRNTTND